MYGLLCFNLCGCKVGLLLFVWVALLSWVVLIVFGLLFGFDEPSWVVLVFGRCFGAGFLVWVVVLLVWDSGFCGFSVL